MHQKATTDPAKPVRLFNIRGRSRDCVSRAGCGETAYQVGLGGI